MRQTIEIEVPEGCKAVWNQDTHNVEIAQIDIEPRKKGLLLTREELCEKYPFYEFDKPLDMDTRDIPQGCSVQVDLPILIKEVRAMEKKEVQDKVFSLLEKRKEFYPTLTRIFDELIEHVNKL